MTRLQLCTLTFSQTIASILTRHDHNYGRKCLTATFNTSRATSSGYKTKKIKNDIGVHRNEKKRFNKLRKLKETEHLRFYFYDLKKLEEYFYKTMILN